VAKLPPSEFADRLYFVVWLSALRRGFESGQELARAIDKGPTQLSQWAKKKPTYANIRLLAEAVQISPSWLDDPSSPDAREPELWAEWYKARVAAHAKPQRRRA
jgi:transcriptional regulator with XRE-family HTH domain